ncbi:MAG: hypothetical protein GXO71_07335 [Caldiserica bacterium]|nr:hypothetical protein [Caldisericota bacterium]
MANQQEVKVPVLGEGIKEVEVSFWLKEEGEAVNEGEEIVEVLSDKAVFRVSAPKTGKLGKILKKDGEKVKVGETLGIVE